MSRTGTLYHPALLLIDLQEGFFESPTLARARERLVANCNWLIAAARAAGIPVINVRTVHKKDQSTWTLKMLDDQQGYLFEHTAQAEHLRELDVEGSLEVVKRRDSAFWNTELLTIALQHRIGSLVLAGVSSETCISATATDAFAANLPVFLARDALASEDDDFEQMTLEYLTSQYRQVVKDTRDIVEDFTRISVQEGKS